ncbi:otoancorin-like isoform X1 [Mobula birostris]|uniref:otoancorin-like isoform X1 n=1 Tax=Mobula birostris TaxID=1983395 RepID=UPI003B27D63C
MKILSSWEHSHFQLTLLTFQTSIAAYFQGIVQQPRRLGADLRQMDADTFLLSMRYLYSDGSVELMYTSLSFREIREALLRSPSGGRSLFVALWQRCSPQPSSPGCLELLSKALRLSSAAYLQPEMVTDMPQDLPEDSFKNITAVFKELYDDMTSRCQRAVYEWIRHILQRLNQQSGASGGASWIVAENLWFLGRFVVHLPPEEIHKIGLNEIRLFINYDNATKQLDSVYDIMPATARAFQERINASGFNMANTSTVYRLGLLVCFFDNVQELDTGEARSLLHQMIKCSHLKGFQADVKKLKSQLLGLVLRTQRLNETLGSISDALGCLSFPQLESLPPESVRSAMPILGAVSGWSPGQAVILADKIVGDGGEQLSLSQLRQMGSVVPGLSANTLYNTQAGDLAQAMRGVLTEHGDQLSIAQRLAIVIQIANSRNVSALLDLLDGPFLKELPLHGLLPLKSYNITHLECKELRRSQALFLHHLTSDTLSIQEVIRSGELARGLTCGQLRSLDRPSLLRLRALLRDSLALLSPHQLNCLAWRFLRLAPDSLPPLLLTTLPARVLATSPASVCRPLLAALSEADLSSIIPEPAKRAVVVSRAERCLDYRLLDEYDVDVLGRTICHLSPAIIRTNISHKAMNEALMQLRTCTKLSPAQKSEVRNKIREYYGDPTVWPPELMQDLGLLVTLLSKEDLTTVAEKFPDILLQSALEAEGMAVPQDFLWAVFHALERTSGSMKSSDPSSGCTGARTPSSDHILKLADANSYWSARELRCLSQETFVRSVELLGAVKAFSVAQLEALKEKAKEVWGPVLGWKKHQVRALGRIVLSLSEEEIAELDLGSIDTVVALNRHSEWSPPQVRAILDGFLRDSSLAVGALDGWALAGLGSFLCAMTSSEVDSVNAAAYSVAAARVGEVTCRLEVQQRLLRKAREVFGDIHKWPGFVLWEVGAVAAGMSREEIKDLNRDLMPYFKPAAVAALPADVFQALSPRQLLSLGPENAAAVTEAQTAALDPDQTSSLLAARDGGEAEETSPSTSPITDFLTGSACRGDLCLLLWAATAAVCFAS